MRRRVEADPEPPRLQLGGEEGAGRTLAVGTADVDSREAALRVVECGEEPLGGSEAPFDAAGLSGEEEAAGVREGQPAQSAASTGRRPAMWRSSWAVVSRSSLRGTTMSTIPCSTRNSAVWNPSGRSCPIVCLITRGPAKPTTAPGSAMMTSPCIAYEADTPPVVGFVRIEMKGIPSRASSARTTDVLAICMRERAPSCMRAPPEAET